MNTTALLTKNAIIKSEQEILLAMKNCDVQKLDELVHEQLLFTIPNGQTITKAQDLETYRSGNMKITEISASAQEIQFIDTTAVVSVIIEMKGTYFEHLLDGKYKVIRVWKLCSTAWKVIAGSSNIMI
ncbi:nuclear transport factor 2 family protein [uncultured Kordia sp.]|uniref:nuclear transport factor 2 family protein n=1 Tax=uncultured Kordia sp. TaxID=507699 RepID=UPI00260805D1|nr:nuclear transport factor 2 family protein [uncultured Kordia sp.]